MGPEAWVGAHLAATLHLVAVIKLETRRRHTYAGEEIWFPLLKQFGPSALRRAFIRCGVPSQVAGNLVWFLEDQLLLERTQAERTRGRYRDVLEQLDPGEVLAAARTIPGQFNQEAA